MDRFIEILHRLIVPLSVFCLYIFVFRAPLPYHVGYWILCLSIISGYLYEIKRTRKALEEIEMELYRDGEQYKERMSEVINLMLESNKTIEDYNSWLIKY